MNNTELADRIVERFTPVAFLCDCQNEHSECAEVKTTDTYAIAQADTAYRIAEFVRGIK